MWRRRSSAAHRPYGVGIGVAAGSAVAAIGGGGPGALAGAVFALPGAFVSSAVVRRSGSVGRDIVAGTAASTALGTGLGLLASGGSGWFSGPEMIAAGAVVGVVLGAVSSTAAGIASRPRWERVERLERDRVRVGVAPVRGGFAAQVQVAF